MPLNFPSNPGIGDTYGFSDKLWTYNGEGWDLTPQQIPQGPKGDQGIQGVQGLQGVQGPLSNFQGTQGVQGPLSNFQGTQGTQGIQGIQGLQGLQGLSNQGVQGNQGNQGSQGTQGLQGVQGIRLQVYQQDSPVGINSQVGDLWIDTTSAITYTYYYDGDSYQWVEFGPEPTGPTGPVGGSAKQVIYKTLNNQPAGSDQFVFDGTNVGVGTTTPQYKVDVVGNVNFTGNLYQNGVLFTPGGGGGGESYWASNSVGIHTLSNAGIGTTSIIDSRLFVLSKPDEGIIARNWVLQYGNLSQFSEGNTSIALDSNSNIYLIGESGSTFFSKFDVHGNVIWDYRFNDSGSNISYSNGIVVDSNDNIYITQDGNPNGLLKYDSSGNEIWQISMDIPGNDTSIAIGTSDSVYIAGYDSCNIKISSSGIVEWEKSITDGGGSYGIIVDSNENSYICGETASNDAYLTKFDSSGNAVWSKFVDSGDVSEARSLAVDSSNNVYFTATVNLNGEDTLLVKVSPSGSIIWQKRVGNQNANSFGSSVEVDANDNVYLIFSYYSTSSDIGIVKYDSSGNLLWKKGFGSLNSESTLFDWGTKNVRVKGDNLFIAGYGNNLGNNNVLIGKFTTDGNFNGSYGNFKVYDIDDPSFISTTTSYSFADYTATIESVGVTTLPSTFIGVATNFTITGNALTVEGQKYNALTIQGRTQATDLVSIGSSTLKGIRSDKLKVYGNTYVAGDLGIGTVNTDAKVSVSGIDTSMWIVEYGDIGIGNTTEYFSGVAFDSQGNIYTSGSDDGAYPTYPYVIKFNNSGSIVWKKYLTHPDPNKYYSICEAVAVDKSTDSVYAAVMPDDNSASVILLKLDANTSDIIWQKEVTNDDIVDYGYEYATAIGIGTTGSIYLCATTDAELDRFEKPLIIKFDSSGNVQWQKLLDYPSKSMQAYDIAIDSNDNIHVATWTNWYSSQPYGWGGGLFKLDSSGNLLWGVETFQDYPDYVGSTNINNVAVDSLGNVYVAGNTGIGYSGSTNDRTIILIKYSSSGKEQWRRGLGIDSITDYMWGGIVCDSENNVYYSAQVTSQPSQGNNTLCIIKYDTFGNLIYQRTLGGDPNENYYQWYYWGHRYVDILNNELIVGGYVRTSEFYDYNGLLLKTTLDCPVGNYGPTYRVGISTLQDLTSGISTVRTGVTTSVVSVASSISINVGGLTTFPSPAYAKADISYFSNTYGLSVTDGDIKVGINTSHGLVLTSPNGTKYRLTVNDSGVLSTTKITKY